jgi:hypothetical protein
VSEVSPELWEGAMPERTSEPLEVRRPEYPASEIAEKSAEAKFRFRRHIPGESVPVPRDTCTRTLYREAPPPKLGRLDSPEGPGGAMKREFRLSREVDDETRHTEVVFKDSKGREIRLDWVGPVAGAIWRGRRFGRWVFSLLALIAAVITIWVHSCGAPGG